MLDDDVKVRNRVTASRNQDLNVSKDLSGFLLRNFSDVAGFIQVESLFKCSCSTSAFLFFGFAFSFVSAFLGLVFFAFSLPTFSFPT